MVLQNNIVNLLNYWCIYYVVFLVLTNEEKLQDFLETLSE